MSFAQTFTSFLSPRSNFIQSSLEPVRHPRQRHNQPDLAAFLSAGQSLIERARQKDAALTLLVVQLADLPELDLVFGTSAVDRAVDVTLTELLHVAGRKGFAARTTSDTFALFMPEMGEEQLLCALQARLGRPCSIEFELDGQEILMVPDIVIRSVCDADSPATTYRKLCDFLEDERQFDQRRKQYMRQERESHTMPAPLATSRQHAPRAPAAHRYPTIPATIPMPVPAH